MYNGQTVYATKEDAIAQEIVPALGWFVNDFDVPAIADEVLGWYDGYDEDDGLIHLDRQGFYLAVDDDVFWAIVQRHDRAPALSVLELG